jgi:LacI family transcriptional regulator
MACCASQNPVSAMAKRPTIEQLAQAAGVSVATVDRILNKRAPVRRDTADRVYEAAAEIGFYATGLIGRRIREGLPEYRLGFLLLRTGQQFYGAFARELEKAVAGASGFRGVAMIDTVSSQAPAEVAGKLEALSRRANAVAVVAPEHPTLTAAVEDLKRRGIPVFSLLSDFAAGERQGYIGVHNGKVGRTAAWMIARCAKAPGKVALFVGSHRFHGHELREIGFRAFFREEAPEFVVLDTIVNLEDGQLTQDRFLELADKHPDLVGAYVAGGGMEGAISALRGMAPDTRPVTVCNEITPESRAALADNLLTMVIATPLAALSRELVSLMGQALKPGEAVGPSQTFLPFDIHLPESV